MNLSLSGFSVEPDRSSISILASIPPKLPFEVLLKDSNLSKSLLLDKRVSSRHKKAVKDLPPSALNALNPKPCTRYMGVALEVLVKKGPLGIHFLNRGS